MAVHSPVNGTTAIPWRSSRRRLTLLEQLRGCQDAWGPGAPWDRDGAHKALCGTPAGSFLVVQESAESPSSLLCVSAGGEDEAVIDHVIKSTGTVFQLSESRLCFSDLAQLVLFYSLTRDVLAVCLSIPRWIYSVTEKNKDHLSQLKPETWLHTPPEHHTNEMSNTGPSNVMCSIQLTSTNGALCIINPLYLHDHGDDWLTNRAAATPCATQPSYNRKERRLSTTRSWSGAGLLNKRTISLEQESSTAINEISGLTRARSADSPDGPQSPSTPSTPAGVVLRRPSKDSVASLPYRASIESLSSSTPSTPGGSNRTSLELQPHGSPVPQSPHRVSWIEDGVWLPPPRPPSRLHPPSMELDSLSISSIEEEQDQVPGPSPHHQSTLWLADKVINRLSAVGQALGGLVCQKKRLTNRVQELSERKGFAFAEVVKGFVETTLKRGTDPAGVMGSEFLQEVRTSLTSLRDTLLEYADVQALLDSMTDLNDSEIDSLVELSIHKVALKPVSAHIYSCIHASRTNDGSLDCLQSNLRVLEKKGMEGLGGSEGLGVPDSASLERIQQRWVSMHQAYSPDKKVQILLKICKSIYHSMSAESKSGKVFGADDFLPCLTWVLLRSDVTTLQIDTDYMMELLDPSQLQGEGGYYLTTLYASLYYISSFQPRLAARQLSVEAQHSLNQWHRRRTLHCNQSRRSKHRRTIRRTQRSTQNSETINKEESEKKDSSVDEGESQQQTESFTEVVSLEEEKNREQGAMWEAHLSPQASDCDQDVTRCKQEDEQTVRTTEEDDPTEL